ncbi:hypothetical protein V8F20_006300 [Naviculisporaceae sp. PSN 640]
MSGAAVGVPPAAGAATGAAAAGEPLSIHVIWAVVLIGAVIVGAGLSLFLKWLARRRANRHALPDLTGEGAIHATTHPVISSCAEEGSPKKLQKVAWAAGTATAAKGRVVSRASWSTGSSDDSDGVYTLLARRHMSLPILRRFSKVSGRFSVPLRGLNSGSGLLSRLSLISKRSSSGGEGQGQKGKGAGTRYGLGHKRNASWIDEDALHGPATSRSNVNLGLCEDLVKDGGIDGGLNRSPTLPMLRRSQVGDGSGNFGLHWEEGVVQFGNLKDVMVMTGAAGGGYPSSPDSYTQVVMEATSPMGKTDTRRSLPEPPKPVVVAGAGAGRERQVGAATVAGAVSSAGTKIRLGHKYSNSEPPMRPVSSRNSSPNTSPVRSLPRTPTRVRTRQPSTDSTLSEILRSTERRLQEGYVSTSNSVRLPRRSRTTAAALGRSQWYGTSRESLLDRSQYSGSGSVIEPGATVHRSRSESKPSTQKRVTISTDVVGSGPGYGHSRQESQTSTISSTSSIELTMISDFNSGLGDCALPSDADTQMLGFQSVRSSVSSALSTIQSEDEIPDRESVKLGSSPLSSPNITSRLGLTINSNNNNNNNRRSEIVQQNAPISAVDPFSNSPWANVPPVSSAVPRPLTINYPTRSQKSPDLLRESLQRSLRTSLLRAPVDQTTLLAQASSLPPLPAAPGGGKPHSFFRGDCPGCCKLGETKTISVQTCAGGSIPGSAAIELPSPSRGELVAPSGGVKGPLGPRSLSVNTGNSRAVILNSIILPPPVAASQYRGVSGNFGNDNSSPPPSPTRRPSSRASISMSASKIHRMSSVSSSVYSQDARELPMTTSPSPIVPMSTNMNENINTNKATSDLPSGSSATHVSAPAPLQTIFKGTRNSADNTKLPKFTGFVDITQKANEGKRVLSLENDSSENDQENIDISASTHTTDFAITSTVAELRRMNSALSMATSVASNDAYGGGGGGGVSDYSRPSTPTTSVTSTSTARLSVTSSGVVKAHKKNKSSSGDSARKAYLSLGGTTTPTSSSNYSPQKRRSVSGAVTTINSRGGSPALRDRSRNVSTTITITASSPAPVVVPGFVAALESATTSPAATSSGSPIKKKRRTVGGVVARMSPGPGSGLLGRKVSEVQQEKYRFDDSDSPDQSTNNKNKDKDKVKAEEVEKNASNQPPNSNNEKQAAATTPTSAPGQRVSFKFPSIAVQATNFTFQVIPASSPISSPSGSNPNPSTPRNNNHNVHATDNQPPTKRHRRHNSSHDSSLLRVQGAGQQQQQQQQYQWVNDPLTVARIRDSNRTPSPPKNSNMASSLSGYTYSPPKTPAAGQTKRVFPAAMQMEIPVPAHEQQNQEDVSPLQIPLKSPRRQQQHRFVIEQYQYHQVPQGQQEQPQSSHQQALTSEEDNTNAPKKTETQTQTQTPYTQKIQQTQIQTPGTTGTGRKSVESLGLYDKDGFLINNSPVRVVSPVRCR